LLVLVVCGASVRRAGGWVIVTQDLRRSEPAAHLVYGRLLSQARSVLRDAGYTIVVASPIDDQALAEADVFYLSLPPRGAGLPVLTESEIGVLLRFVSRGGGLVVQSALGYQEASNVVAEPFGVRFSSEVMVPPWFGDSWSPIGNGPAGVGSDVELGAQAPRIEVIDDSALADVFGSVGHRGSAVLGAIWAEGTAPGRLVFISTIAPFVDPEFTGLNIPDHFVLWENIFAFAVPEPASPLTLLMGFSAMVCSRRRRG